ncbi:MAG: MBL fold metallo-hydrolase, partial [Microgenomates group bacterium]
HGSKNGLTRELLDASMPEIAILSVGKNHWGHPHKEILDLLDSAGILVKRTDLEGDIEIVSDGKSWWIKN